MKKGDKKYLEINKILSISALLILLSILASQQFGCSDKATNSEPTLSDFKLAFVHESNNNQDIYIINPDGTELTQLTSSDENNYNPIWSPDGQYIYYQTQFNSAGEIFRMDIDGADKINITNHSAWDYLKDISPDGTKMVFTSTRTGRMEIFLMDLTDSSVIQMTNEAYGEFGPVCFTPDADQIIYSTSGSSAKYIYVINIADTAHTKISGDYNAYNVVISPNGLRLAYVSQQYGTNFSDIYVCDIDGSNPDNISQSSNYSSRPCWSPNSQKVAYAEAISGSLSNIFTVNADGTERVCLTDSIPTNFEPKWSPDGSSIAYIYLSDSSFEIYIMDADGANKTPLTNSDARKNSLVWSPAL